MILTKLNQKVLENRHTFDTNSKSDLEEYKYFLTNNPEPNTTNPKWCCNEEYKAKRRAIYASTNLKKNYYTSTKQYLQNRCKTYDQKAFNFLSYRTNDAGPYDNNNPGYLHG